MSLSYIWRGGPVSRKSPSTFLTAYNNTSHRILDVTARICSFIVTLYVMVAIGIIYMCLYVFNVKKWLSNAFGQQLRHFVVYRVGEKSD